MKHCVTFKFENQPVAKFLVLNRARTVPGGGTRYHRRPGWYQVVSVVCACCWARRHRFLNVYTSMCTTRTVLVVLNNELKRPLVTKLLSSFVTKSAFCAFLSRKSKAHPNTMLPATVLFDR
jgi:hypothetical protein